MFYLQQVLGQAVPPTRNLSTLSEISQIAEHAAFANGRGLAGKIGVVLTLWTDVDENTLEDVIRQATYLVACATTIANDGAIMWSVKSCKIVALHARPGAQMLEEAHDACLR